jgi:hypothetical protein
MDNPADHTPVIDTPDATGLRKVGLDALQVGLGEPKSIRHRQILL